MAADPDLIDDRLVGINLEVQHDPVPPVRRDAQVIYRKAGIDG